MPSSCRPVFRKPCAWGSRGVVSKRFFKKASTLRRAVFSFSPGLIQFGRFLFGRICHLEKEQWKKRLRNENGFWNARASREMFSIRPGQQNALFPPAFPAANAEKSEEKNTLQKLPRRHFTPEISCIIDQPLSG